MKKFVILLLLVSWQVSAANFKEEAASLAKDLRTNLMKNLSDKIAKEGVIAAIPFCHGNVRPLAKAAARDRINKYEFGRTSHRTRNEGNIPKDWIRPYIEEYKGTFAGDKRNEPIVGKLKDGKYFFLEPIYVMPLCLNCHGTDVKPEVKSKILSLYPKDEATGFKLNEFRGFIWIKEK